MSLKEQIQQNLNKVLKEGRKLEASTLRMLLAAINNKEIEKRKKEEGLSHEEIIEVISTEIKKRKEAQAQYEKGERLELAEKEKKEFEILLHYMPEQLSDEEVEKLAKEVIAALQASLTPSEREKFGVKDLGKVMGALMPQVKGKVDGQKVSNVIKELLSKEEGD